jgi:hypothetical protein
MKIHAKPGAYTLTGKGKTLATIFNNEVDYVVWNPNTPRPRFSNHRGSIASRLSMNKINCWCNAGATAIKYMDFMDTIDIFTTIYGDIWTS